MENGVAIVDSHHIHTNVHRKQFDIRKIIVVSQSMATFMVNDKKKSRGSYFMCQYYR